jgi:hypothetical protein
MPKPTDRTLADMWATYAQLVIPPTMSEAHIAHHQFAFYAGASYVLDMLVAIGDDAVSEQTGIETLTRMRKEPEALAAQQGAK